MPKVTCRISVVPICAPLMLVLFASTSPVGARPLQQGSAAANELVRAAGDGSLATVRGLLDRGVDPDTKVGERYPHIALVEAARAGHVEVVNLLLERDADVNATGDTRGNGNQTALRAAAFSEHAEVVTTLLEDGADANAHDVQGRTALLFAASGFDAEAAEATVRALVEHGADASAQDDYGNSALMSAVLNGHTRTVDLLLERGADVNATSTGESGQGATALQIAAARGQVEMVTTLLALAPRRSTLDTNESPVQPLRILAGEFPIGILMKIRGRLFHHNLPFKGGGTEGGQ